MAVILEIKSGPFKGQRFAVVGGQTVTVGRTSRSNFVVPHDTFMSGSHFSVTYGPKGCILADQKSANGTFVNGARVTQVPLKSGDEVRSGQTVFLVRMVDQEADWRRKKSDERDDSQSRSDQEIHGGNAQQTARDGAVITIGGWTLSKIPGEWAAEGEYGIQRNVPDAFASSAVVTEEPLGNGISLQEYVESQLAMLRQWLREPQIDATLPPTIRGADEAIAVEVRYKTKEGQGVFYRRVYARSGRRVGVLTLTTLQAELAQVRPAFETIVSGAWFTPGANT
ncbi:MAG: FHA domain-containing protein [Candidatus Acidiferrales bacterium]